MTFDVYLFSLVRVLLDDVGKTTPSDYIVIFDFLLENSARVFPFAICSDRERSDFLSVWSFFDLGSGGHISDELNFIEGVGHIREE